MDIYVVEKKWYITGDIYMLHIQNTVALQYVILDVPNNSIYMVVKNITKKETATEVLHLENHMLPLDVNENILLDTEKNRILLQDAIQKSVRAEKSIEDVIIYSVNIER